MILEALVSLLAAFAGTALVVHRAPSAADCPDALALSSIIARLSPKAPTPDVVATPDGFEVEFSRAAGRYRAIVRSRGARAGVRTLEDAGATCQTLAEATALTIAVIVDPDGVTLGEPPEKKPVEQSAETGAPPPAPPPPVEGPPPIRSAGSWSLAAQAGGGVSLGVVRGVAPLATVSLELRPSAHLSFEVGGAFVPTQGLALGPGSIDVWLLTGAASACVWPYARAVRLGACASVIAGAVHGEGRGYPTQSGASRPWLAGALSIGANGPIHGVMGWFGRAGVVVPTHRESFGIDGVGVAYEAPSAGGLLAAGLTFTIR